MTSSSIVLGRKRLQRPKGLGHGARRLVRRFSPHLVSSAALAKEK